MDSPRCLVCKVAFDRSPRSLRTRGLPVVRFAARIQCLAIKMIFSREGQVAICDYNLSAVYRIDGEHKLRSASKAQFVGLKWLEGSNCAGTSTDRRPTASNKKDADATGRLGDGTTHKTLEIYNNRKKVTRWKTIEHSFSSGYVFSILRGAWSATSRSTAHPGP